MPKITCIVPNYNHARFLPERLDSVLAQTRMPDEIILLDDASSDNSCEILREYAERYPLLMSCHFNEENSGTPFVQWKKGVGLANGEFIWIAESDDVADPRFLETLVPMLEADPKVGIAYCQSYKIDDLGENLGDCHHLTNVFDSKRSRQPFTNDGRDECVNYLLWKNTISNASAVLFRKTAYNEVDDSPLELRLCGDWLTWISMLYKFDISYTPRILNSFRWHDASVRETAKDQVYREESWRLQQYILRNFEVPPQNKTLLLNNYLQLIEQSLPVLRPAMGPDVVIDNYEQKLGELLKDMNNKQINQFVENENIHGPLSKKLADYGNKVFSDGNYKLARAYYIACLDFKPRSPRSFIHIITTYFPWLRKLAQGRI